MIEIRSNLVKRPFTCPGLLGRVIKFKSMRADCHRVILYSTIIATFIFARKWYDKRTVQTNAFWRTWQYKQNVWICAIRSVYHIHIWMTSHKNKIAKNDDRESFSTIYCAVTTRFKDWPMAIYDNCDISFCFFFLSWCLASATTVV